jgi:membrane-bound lytic murein transglycosylase D
LKDVRRPTSIDLRQLCALVALSVCLIGCGAQRGGSDSAADLQDVREANRAGARGGPAAPEQNGHAVAASHDTEASAEPRNGVAAHLDETWSRDAALEEPAPDDALQQPAEDEPAPAPDPATLATEALEAVEAARALWEQGEIDAALATLDLAYELLLQLPADDPDLYQQREDLRHLISRSIMEIYRSRLNTAADPGSPIPLEMNEHIEREIKSFQGPEREFFLQSYRRSGQYRPMIVRMLHEAGLPEELSWLPLVESGFKTRALSRARALGMWQFISSTGSRFSLGRSHWVDERMDPEESTRAAIEYLTELHGMFGDWMSALAGYNCGEHRVMRTIKSQNNDYLDHFWDLYMQLPRETARYVPRFLATVLIVGDPDEYGFELPEPLPPVTVQKVTITRHARLEDLDGALGLEKGTLSTLNPALRRGITPKDSYSLNVPPTVAPMFETKLASLPPYVPPEDTYTVHRVRRGETLSTIARRYGSSVNSIVRTNNLRSRNRIYVGQRLKVPHRGAGVSVARSTSSGGKATSTTHTVRRGDSLWRLASRYGTTVDRIKADNGLRNDRLYVGQRLRINTGVPEGARTYAVRRGDTISRIAKSYSVSINSILQANGLGRRSTIYPGQVLVIPD